MYDFIDTASVQPLDEAYVGRTKDIDEALEIMRSIGTGPNGGLRIEKVVDEYGSGKKWSRIEDALAKEFNVDSFILDVQFAATSVNAMTIPISPTIVTLLQTGGIGVVRRRSGGFAYVKPKGKTIYVALTGPLLRDLTPEEIMAIVLHEVGHNFYQGGVLYVTMQNLLQIHAFVYKTGLGVLKSVKKLRALALFLKILGGIGILASTFKNIMKPLVLPSALMGAVQRIGSIKTGSAALPLGVILSVASEGYPNEKVADTFPVIYGFGPEFATAMKKMATGSVYANNVEVLKVTRLMHTSLVILVAPMDAHPFTETRLKNAIAVMDNEVAGAKNPRLKKALEVERAAMIETYRQLGESNTQIGRGAETTMDWLKDHLLPGNSIDSLEAVAMAEDSPAAKLFETLMSADGERYGPLFLN